MKYFLHKTDSFLDEKVTELFLKYGYEGLGLFYTVLEKLGAAEQPVKTEVLKKQLFVGKKLGKCWSFMESLGLLSSKKGETFNENLLKYSGKFQIKREKNTKRVSEFRERQADTENVTHYSSVSNAFCNAPVTPVKESKVNSISKEESGKEAAAPPAADAAATPPKKKGGAGKEKKEGKDASLRFPDWAGPDFMAGWDRWLAYRQGPGFRKKLGHASLQRNLDKLAAFDEAFCVAQFDYVVTNGYQGLLFDNTAEKFAQYLQNQQFNDHGNHPSGAPRRHAAEHGARGHGNAFDQAFGNPSAASLAIAGAVAKGGNDHVFKI